MIIDCISDLHGHYPELPGGDLLIVAGDLTASSSINDLMDFYIWLQQQEYTRRIFIAGNHDARFEYEGVPGGHRERTNITYLCDSGTDFEGLKIWGSPWTKSFPGMNPNCNAFTVDTDEELAEKWALIPDDVDILVTHTPPFGYRDVVEDIWAQKAENVGSLSLYNRMMQIDTGKRRRLVCGHVHEGYGVMNISNMLYDRCTWRVINASYVNRLYQPVNALIRIEL